MSTKSYERLGAFYLGRRFDEGLNEIKPEPLLYDAKDLTTHAVCVGMTGSGKTGLGVTLIEQAALDGIRGAGRAARERGDIARAKERVATLQRRLQALEQQFEDDLETIESGVSVEALDIKELTVACRKTDLEIQPLVLVWVPFRVDAAGIAEPAYKY